MSHSAGRLPGSMLAVALASLATVACGDPTGSSAVEGLWDFDATYGGNGFSCSISGATLSLQRQGAQWTGSLAGGESQCVAPPGDPPLPPRPLAAALDTITVKRDSVTFSLAGEPFTAKGVITDDQMTGTVQAATPFCQCTDPFLSGTWTATRAGVSTTSQRL